MVVKWAPTGRPDSARVTEISSPKAPVKVPTRVVSQFCVIDYLCGRSHMEGETMHRTVTENFNILGPIRLS